MAERILNTLFYAGADRSSINRVTGNIRSTNRTMITTLSLIATILITVMLVISFHSQGLLQNRIVYIAGASLSALVFLLSFLAIEHDWLVNPLMWAACFVYYVYGIFLGTITEPEGKTVTFIVMLVFMPILFIQRPFKIIIMTAVYDAIFIVLCLINKTGKVQTIDIIDGVMFGILGMASGIIISEMKVRGYISEQKLREISRVDQLTGVNNRNAYELDLFSILEGCRHSMGCVYIDVNGLHELNNKKGHKAGDIMLKYIARFIGETFQSGAIYRIGGDEFIAFVPDTSKADLRYDSMDLIRKVEEKGYHIAIGYDSMGVRHLLIEDLIKSAEMKMFVDKNQYYKNNNLARKRVT